MAVHFLVSFATLFLENQNFIAFEVIQDFDFHFGVGQIRLTNTNLVVVLDQHDRVKLEYIAFVGLQAVHIHLLLGANLELLALDIHNRNHGMAGFWRCKDTDDSFTLANLVMQNALKWVINPENG